VLGGRVAAAQRARIVAAAHETAPIFRAAWRSFAAPDADVRALAPRVRCPVVFVWATADRFVPLARSLPAIAGFRNARVERVRALHAAHLEQPDVFESLVDGFLAELGAVRRGAGQAEVAPAALPAEQ
jgi:4,5:9,10-diseco-3-hydroxy-5,9,17-trioxoandrosta-1(10),2-diene-4-oate hydrolase